LCGTQDIYLPDDAKVVAKRVTHFFVSKSPPVRLISKLLAPTFAGARRKMPSFSIEAPGEAAPLTEAELVRSLTSAVSQHNPNHIMTGTAQLQQWEKNPGYYRHLQSAYIDQRLPREVRYLAILMLRNGVEKYWRKTALK
jgi:hypothetical protein